MIETIEQIRALLGQLESTAAQANKAIEFRALSGLELPDIICDVVDLLMPELRPYEVSFYIYLLRHSIVANGTPYVRVSRRGMQSGVMRSAYASGSGETSFAAVRDGMTALESVGAIRQEGEANREGTLYRVLLPEEIEVCQRRRAEQSKRSTAPATVDEADFYNIRENRLKIYERDNYHCTYCNKQLTRFTATLDHITPVSAGGDNSAENLKTACLQCNSRKTARPLGDFLAETDLTYTRASSPIAK
ncbi:MAG TPA: HNH endonuclease signature motif containing protein [Stellaceae bacterium]